MRYNDGGGGGGGGGVIKDQALYLRILKNGVIIAS